MFRQTLTERIDGSEIVIFGKTDQVSDLAYTPRFMSEHEPDWKRVSINVDSVELGKLADGNKTVHVVFPASMDVAWFQSPKFTAGQEGAWILRKEKIRELKTEAYTALHPMDFQGKDSQKLVRDIIKNLPPKKS